MKLRVCAAAWLMAASTMASAQVFVGATYEGRDTVYERTPLEAGEFYNPILQGCYPDPSICRRGDDYFLVCSSFAMFPGVPIFHSTDLVNWKQIGHVLDRKSQLKVFTTGISEGIYAPTIRYNPHNETFYMITTQFAAGMGNIVVKTKNPFEGWSDPIKLNFDGIDPDLFFDDDGKAYIVHNDAPPRGKALYDGHRVIKQWEYDVQADQVVPGSDHILVDGGVDITQQPVWIEAPHIYKKGGRYYLMCAEGGTGDWHSEVIFMADKATGPFVPAANNPILSQRYLNPTRADKVDWAGHADIVSTPKGEYYAVFLAVRPNDKARVNTGRETFILPVDWSGTYPVFVNGLVPMQPTLKMPSGAQNLTGREGYLPAGNFRYDEAFAGPALDYRWIGLRGPREDFVGIRKGGGLQVRPFDTNMKAKAPISALFWRQQHRDFSFTTTLEYTPKKATDLAGIAAVQSERYHYVMGITTKEKQPYIVLERTARGRSQVVASAPIELKKKQAVTLRVTAHGDSYSFSYSTDGTAFANLGGEVSGDILSTDVAGGFTGCMVGLYATTGNDIIPNN